MKNMSSVNRNLKILGYIIFISLTFVSCEGYTCNHGVVVDSNTLKPIDSVYCVSNGGNKVYTDSLGRYEEICSPFAGCMPKCSELVVEFSKEGYKTQNEANKFDTIYLERLEFCN
jgi:hypothetical protein